MNCNSLNFSVSYLPTFQEIYIVTGTTTEIIQHKLTYRCSGRRFSGAGFAGDGFAGAGFAGFSFRGFLFWFFFSGPSSSGPRRWFFWFFFSSSSGSSSRRNRNLLEQRHNLSISLFSLFSL